jgi:protein required for attachment to host cells
MAKGVLKNMARHSEASKERADSFTRKPKVHKKSESKGDSSIATMKNFAEGMDCLLERTKTEEPIDSITLQYAKELIKFSSTNES